MGRVGPATTSDSPRRPDTWFWLIVAAIAVVGVALRVLLIIGYDPANLSYADERSYVAGAAGPLFSNPFRPAGYSVFLRTLHLLSADLRVTIVVQHLVGLATAAMLYFVSRRTGARRWVALIPAGLVALSGDQLYVEHVLLAEGLFIALLLLACYYAMRLLDRRPEARWWQGVGWLLAAAITVAALAVTRTVAVVLVPVFLLWVLAVSGPQLRRRLIFTGIGGVICAGMLLGYALAQQQATGVFGLSRFGGWPLYARVAPVADCRRFSPPPGTESLCERTPVSERPGPNYYLWDPRSPARREFGFPPAHAADVARFARAAIVHEPGEYLATVARDLARFVDPALVTRPQWGGDYRSLSLNARDVRNETDNLPAVRAYWRTPRVHLQSRIVLGLEGWRRVFRIHGAVIGICALLALIGLGLAREARERRSLALLAAFSAALFVAPVAVNVYEARYGVPAAILLLVAGVRGAELLACRFAPRRDEESRPPPVARVP